ncbi:amino acid ABC transporter substrate-binding protein [Comamonas testosteroni]|uniref:Amino acid ABC transporter substrate-binding protein n=1 Tax=Comamonas testosteroni TaxID=285 RepID=A0A373FSW5_COMTE|nr:amino acid ABC transporter substrate-binding protein [Comamonas testosteroni]RGE46947.1 amino acid ABC transporter substrate-binding protein [Comamonas testosteroni]
MLTAVPSLRTLRKTVTGLSAAVAVLAGFTALQTQAAELEKIKSAGRIVIAHRESSIPFSYWDAKKQPVGYAVDLCRKIAEAVRVQLQMPALPIEYLPVTSASRLAAIAEGKASLECGSTTNNAERRKLVDFTIPHYVASVRLLVPAASQVKTMEDLAGKVVVSTQGTTSLNELNRINAERVLKMQITPVKDHQEGFNAVAENKAAAFAMDDVLLAGLRAQSKEPAKYAIVGKAMTVEPYAIVLPKGDAAFKKVVNQEMLRLIRSGELQELYNHWFQKPIAPNGINLQWPMPYLLRESLRFPTDKVGD